MTRMPPAVMKMPTNNTDHTQINDKAKRLMEGIGVWGAYYRANPHRFCVEYLGLMLYPFQQILLVIMNIMSHFMYIAARGQGKSYLTAIFCCVRCILYPGTLIAIASKTRGQAQNVLKKITDILMIQSPNLCREIKDYKMNQTESYIEFHNGSKIFIVTAGESGRSVRAHIIIVDEFRLVDKEIITAILKKFRADRRHPGFLNLPKYKKYPRESNKEMYLSSAWYQSHWSYEKAQTFFRQMTVNALPYFVCGLPYQVSIQTGLLDPQQVYEDMSEGDFDEISWMMEMEALFYSDTEGSLFTHEDVNANRNLSTVYYPPEMISNLQAFKLPKIPELLPHERRILSADIALLASRRHENDAASIWINRALPNSRGKLTANFVYTENHEGLHTSDLALRIRKLFDQFHCTDIALDVRGVGVGIYDALCRDIYDPTTGETYQALSCCNDAAYAARCNDPTAPKVIWAIQASSQFNNDMYLALRDGFKQHRINLLMTYEDFNEEMSKNKAFVMLDGIEKEILRSPFRDTDLLVNEAVNLQCEAKGTVLKVSERSGMRKDRVSSVGYNYHVMLQIDRKQRTSADSLDWRSLMSFRPPQMTKQQRRW